MPTNQGDLDGLCGIYSVVNAVKCLKPYLPNTTKQELFDKMIEKAPKDAVVRGLSVWELITIVNSKAVETLLCSIGISIRLVDSKAQRKDSFFTFLGDNVKEKSSVVIIGVLGKIGHWTVVRKVTDQQLQLEDGAMKVINYSQCEVSQNDRKVKYNLCTDEVFIVEMK